MDNEQFRYFVVGYISNTLNNNGILTKVDMEKILEASRSIDIPATVYEPSSNWISSSACNSSVWIPTWINTVSESKH